MKKQIISITLFLSSFLISSNCYSFQNEPDGFRGIKWGTKLETIFDNFNPMFREKATDIAYPDIYHYIKKQMN